MACNKRLSDDEEINRIFRVYKAELASLSVDELFDPDFILLGKFKPILNDYAKAELTAIKHVIMMNVYERFDMSKEFIAKHGDFESMWLFEMRKLVVRTPECKK